MSDDLKQAIKALRIYDECVEELSCFVGHMGGRCGEQAYLHAVEQCKKAMRAKKILDRLTTLSRNR